MNLARCTGVLTAGTVLATIAAMSTGGAALAAPSSHLNGVATLPLRVKVVAGCRMGDRRSRRRRRPACRQPPSSPCTTCPV
jgi:hypothetical protein